MFETRPMKVEPLGERIAGELRRGIILGEIRGETRLVEEELAQTYQVSRGPVRDALSILRTEGLVTGTGRHAVTRSLTEADIDELMALREAFEMLAVERAMMQHQSDLVEQLLLAIEEMEQSASEGDSAAFTNADIRYHSAFFEAAGGMRLQLLWNQFRPAIEGLLHASGRRLDDLKRATDEHQHLVTLIAGGDAAVVKAELHRHLQTTCMRLRKSVRDPQT